jgi:hypothetical protein
MAKKPKETFLVVDESRHVYSAHATEAAALQILTMLATRYARNPALVNPSCYRLVVVQDAFPPENLS